MEYNQPNCNENLFLLEKCIITITYLYLSAAAICDSYSINFSFRHRQHKKRIPKLIYGVVKGL